MSGIGCHAECERVEHWTSEHLRKGERANSTEQRWFDEPPRGVGNRPEDRERDRKTCTSEGEDFGWSVVIRMPGNDPLDACDQETVKGERRAGKPERGVQDVGD